MGNAQIGAEAAGTSLSGEVPLSTGRKWSVEANEIFLDKGILLSEVSDSAPLDASPATLKRERRTELRAAECATAGFHFIPTALRAGLRARLR